MSSASSNGQIAVNNKLLEGVSPKAEMPTYILNTLGLSTAEVEESIESVGLLQAMAPVFRVVLATDQPVFGAARPFGWPVEHFLAHEHWERTAGPERRGKYTIERLQIAKSHYQNATVLNAARQSSFAGSIAALIGCSDLMEVAHSLSGQGSSARPGTAHWSTIERELRTTGTTLVEGAEGRAEISCIGPIQDSIFIDGRPSSNGTNARRRETPSWVCSIVIEFDTESSLAFESHLYATIAHELGGNLAIAQPWRREGLLSEQSLHWIDLGVHGADLDLRIRPEFLETYKVLAGSDRLDWNHARKYAAIRRLSRTFSSRKAVGG